MEGVADKTRACHHTAEGQNRFHFALPNGSSCRQENQRRRFEFRALKFPVAVGRSDFDVTRVPLRPTHVPRPHARAMTQSHAFSRRWMEPILSIMTLIWSV